MSEASKNGFGVFVITASAMLLLLSGCAAPAGRMSHRDLDTFVVDCRKKAEQIRFIESQYAGHDAKAGAMMAQFVMPWTLVTDPEGTRQTYQITNGQYNWTARQILMELGRCPAV
jgi:hypothetical protein